MTGTVIRIIAAIIFLAWIACWVINFPALDSMEARTIEARQVETFHHCEECEQAIRETSRW